MTTTTLYFGCAVCGSSRERLVGHHVIGRLLAPAAVVTLCEPCHVQLHRRRAKLWRNPTCNPSNGQPAHSATEPESAIESVRLGLLRLAETVDFIVESHDGNIARELVVTLLYILLGVVIDILDLLAGRLLPSAVNRNVGVAL